MLVKVLAKATIIIRLISPPKKKEKAYILTIKIRTYP